MTGTLSSTDTKAEITISANASGSSISLSMVTETKDDTVDSEIKLGITQGSETYDLGIRLLMMNK